MRKLYLLLSILIFAINGMAFDGDSTVYTVRQAQLLKLLPATSVAGEEPSTPDVTLRRALGKATMGYGINDGQGLVSFPLTRPSARDLVAATDLYISAGTKIGKYFYYITYTPVNNEVVVNSVVRLDTATKRFSNVALFPSNQPIPVDMTYNPVNGKTYVVGSSDKAGVGALYTLDVNKARFTKVADFPGVRIYGIASDQGGQLYGISFEGKLFKINGDNGSIVPIGDTGVKATYISSMAFDTYTHDLYYACCQDNGVTPFYKIDPLTATATRMGYIGNTQKGYETIGLVIGNSDPEAKAPAIPANFTVTPGANGAVNAQVAWTNPSTAQDGSALTSLNSVSLYVNDKLAKSYSNPAIGGAVSEQITSGLVTGFNSFRVVASNEAGESYSSERIEWIGQDLPSAPTNIHAKRSGSNSATITWDAPTTTLHGGYLNTSRLRYRIERFNITKTDSVTLSRVYRGGTTYEDNQINKINRYYYRITSLTNDYGDYGLSDSIMLGPAENTPYSCTFSTMDSFYPWTTYDCNGDGRTWTKFSTYRYVYNMPMGRKADDWLISPPIKLQKDSTYYLYMESYTGEGEFYPKDFDVTIGKTSDYKDHTTVLRHVHFAHRNVEQTRITLPIDTTGEYFIGIHDVSEYHSCQLRFSNFYIGEKHTGLISGKVSDANGNAIKGAIVTIPRSTVVDTTDAAGNYAIDYIMPAGNYMLKASAYGYYDKYASDSIYVDVDKITTYNLQLDARAIGTISGTITDPTGVKVRGAKVTVSGYGDTRTATTDADGHYSIDNLYAAKYRVQASKFKFITKSDSIDFAGTSSTDMTISPKALVPSDFTATASDADTVALKWDKPLEIFRHDNGSFESQGGVLSGTRYTLIGSVFNTPAKLRSISWVTTSYQGPHNEMNLWVLDITPDGKPTNKVLFNANKVPSKGDEVWNTYELPEPVECPNGFYLGVSYDYGMASLAKDNGQSPDWPFIPYINYRAIDYRTNNWYCMDESFITENYLIRATGDDIDSTMQSFDYKYRIYRFAEDDLIDESKWTLVVDSTDKQQAADYLKNVADGTYIYALQALYPNGVKSDYVYSESVSISKGHATGIDAINASNVDIDVENGNISTSQNFDEATAYSLTGAVLANAKNSNALNITTPGVCLVKIKAGGKIYVRKIIVK